VKLFFALFGIFVEKKRVEVERSFLLFSPLFVWECFVKKQTIGSSEEKWR
jgi:hypothetical protein